MRSVAVDLGMTSRALRGWRMNRMKIKTSIKVGVQEPIKPPRFMGNGDQG